MAIATASKGPLSVKAYSGDAKTLLAFDLDEKSAKGLAGFTIEVRPAGKPAYYLSNSLQFEKPADHAQDPKEPATSSVNAPIHKFRWLHVPGSHHQGTKPFLGKYTYTVTPRYFDKKGALRALDASRSASVAIQVVPFKKAGLEVGFTRGFTQSQAFVRHFGAKTLLRPKGADLLFSTSEEAGANAAQEKFTYADEYEWLGFTAREKIFALLNEVLGDKALHLDMFAYDLNEPDVLRILLLLAGEGRIRLILDDATLHHDKDGTTAEDRFEALFTGKAKDGAAIQRGHYGRFAHDKVMIVSKAGAALKVLTGSTNFSVTGVYVNSNHILVFNDPAVAKTYSDVFESVWGLEAAGVGFAKTPLASQAFPFSSAQTPQTEITFAPHTKALAAQGLQSLADRIGEEGKKGGKGNVLFAVMQLDNGTGPVLPALDKLHSDQNVFSFGISDSPSGIQLYKPGAKKGILVTGKPVGTKLPKPFSQVPGVGLGHQIHHKFVVCGFNRKDAVVYCGSSNLAEGGEASNGDNLIAIHDQDVATAFAIEAIGLVDHFNFLDGVASAPNAPKDAKSKPPAAAKEAAAADAGWFLSTTDVWTKVYYDPEDLHSMDRQLFA